MANPRRVSDERPSAPNFGPKRLLWVESSHYAKSGTGGKRSDRCRSLKARQTGNGPPRPTSAVIHRILSFIAESRRCIRPSRLGWPPDVGGSLRPSKIQTSSIPPARRHFAQRIVPLSRPSPRIRTSIRSPSSRLHLALTQKPALERFKSVPMTIAPSPRAIVHGWLLGKRSGRFGYSVMFRSRPRPE